MSANVLVVHGGGPTAVINASLYGVVEEARNSGSIGKVYGAIGGSEGILKEQFLDLMQYPEEKLSLLLQTPATAIGSSRYALKQEDYNAMAGIFRKYGIRYVLLNGGNGTMDTCGRIFEACRGEDIYVVGIPKTIDNDLFGTDHCPGFASAAKYIATSCAEVWQDAHVYDTGMVTVIEIMGRHAGWLAGSAALATWAGFGPDLVYLPEVDFDMEKFIADVQAIYDKTGKCMVAVSEGIHYADGSFVSEAKTSATDGFGHAQLGGLATMLAEVIKQKTGAKVRGIELSLLQRCGAHLASHTDIEEAKMAGRVAVEAAVAGNTDKMVAFQCTRDGGKYECKTVLEPLDIVANFEKKVPREWINAEGNGVEQAFIDYVLPLIQGEPERPKEHALPRFAKLNKVLTTDL